MTIDDLRYKHSFRKLSNGNELIYGLVLNDQSAHFRKLSIEKINISVKNVEFDDSGVLLRSVVFNLPIDPDNDLYIFLLDTFIVSNSNGVNFDDLEKLIKVLKSLHSNKYSDYYGLIGECVFIYYLIINNQRDQITAWHSEISDTYDFVSGDTVYEIKSTSGNIRRHSLKYTQHDFLLRDFRKKKYYISIVISNYLPQFTLLKLVDEIRNLLDGDTLSKFNSTISKYDKRLFDYPDKFNLDKTLESIVYVDVHKIGEITVINNLVDFNNLSIPVFFDIDS